MSRMSATITKVFGKPAYAALALVVALVTFAMAVWMPNLGLIARVFLDPGVVTTDKFALPLSLLGSITTNFSLLTASYTVAIALLFGLNASLIAYFFKRRIATARGNGMAVGFTGMVSGVLGVGCAACGSFLLSTILSAFGAAGALALLPLGGGEFGILAVGLLGLSIHLTAKQIENPTVCST